MIAISIASLILSAAAAVFFVRRDPVPGWTLCLGANALGVTWDAIDGDTVWLAIGSAVIVLSLVMLAHSARARRAA